MTNFRNKASSKDFFQGFSSKAVHAGAPRAVGEPTGISLPISSSWILPESGDGGLEQDYGRVGTSLMSRLEEQVGALDRAKYCTVFASGISALNALVHSLEENKLIIAEKVTYGCTMRMLSSWERFGVRSLYLDLTEEENIQRIRTEAPALVMIESPTNPLLKILDIGRIAQVTHDCGGILSVDNSFASSFNQRPLELGADYSVTSLTKYHNGHSTGMVGAVCTNNPLLADSLYFQRKAIGLQPGALECSMTVQGIQTLGLRMERVASNALAVAQFLEKHPVVRSVLYPFLPSHPQYELARRQMRTGSGVVVTDVDLPLSKIDKFVTALSAVFVRAHSIGAVKSQISIPARMSHASVPREQRLAAGITDGLVRLSIGIEEPEDLLGALDYAFAVAVQ
jgi:cystathionine beta-lyase/cystathionine gamma-synthase